MKGTRNIFLLLLTRSHREISGSTLILTGETPFWMNNLGCVFPMVIWSEFLIGQYRDDYPWEDATHFTDGLGYSAGRILQLIEIIKPSPDKSHSDWHFNPKYSTFYPKYSVYFFSFQWFLIGRMTKTAKHGVFNCFIFVNKIIKPWFIISYDSYENAKMIIIIIRYIGAVMNPTMIYTVRKPTDFSGSLRSWPFPMKVRGAFLCASPATFYINSFRNYHTEVVL